MSYRSAFIVPFLCFASAAFGQDLPGTCLHVELVPQGSDTGHDVAGVCEGKPSAGASDDEQSCMGGQLQCTDGHNEPVSSDINTPADGNHVASFVDPVLGDGEFFTSVTDLSYPGFGINFEFKRTYRSRTPFFGPLGHAWDHSYDRRLYGDALGQAYCDGSIDYQNGTLGQVHFKPLRTDLVRVVANTVVSPLSRITSPIALLPHKLVATVGSITTNLPPIKPSTTRIDFAASEGATMTLSYDSSLPNPWIMRELSGVISYFDNDGHLAAMQHPAGPKMTFTWTSGRLTQIVDTTGRTIHLNYDAAGKFLTCLSTDATCTHPLVSYQYDRAKPASGELTAAFIGDGSTNEGTTRYVYHHGEPSAAYVPTELAVSACDSLCSPRTPTQCRNEDVCHFNACTIMAGPDTVAGRKACMDYCMPGCFAACKKQPAFVGSTQLKSDGQCHTQCTGDCSGSCVDLKQASINCIMALPSYCTAPDCKTTCAQKLSSPIIDGPMPQAYFVGRRSDLNHNLEEIIDNQGRRVVKNTYGSNPGDVSFDKIVDQQVGDVDAPENHAQFEFHDLKAEAATSWPYSNRPSNPNPIVTPLSSFVSRNICTQACGPGQGVNGCVGPVWTYGATWDRPPLVLGNAPAAAQLPRYATVISDLGGLTRVSYFDENWQLLREVDTRGNQREQTDYNYKNGFQVGIQKPAGDRVCTEMAGRVPSQITRLPAPGFAGSTEPQITTLAYDAAAQVTDVVTDPTGDNVRVHYERDVAERVKWVDKSVNASTTERTTYDYDPGMPGPKAVTTPGGGVTTYANYDSVSAAPQLVSVGADGPAPIQTYASFNSDGRVAETGKPNLAGSRYQYAITGRITLVGHRYDAKSPWFDATAAFEPRALQPLTTIGVRVRTVKFFNTQGDVEWKGEQPIEGSQPMRFTCFHYDPEGHLLETILPEGNSIVTTYDVAWRPLSTSQGMRGAAPSGAWAAKCAANTANWSGVLETFASATYSPGGWPQAKTSEGVTVQLVTDGFGRVIEERDALGGVRRRGYDRAGHVAWEAALQPGAATTPYARPQPSNAQVAQMTEFTCDHLGRTLSVTRWHVEDQTAVVKTTEYRDLQRMVVEKEAGLTTTSVFDGAGRLVSKTLPDGSMISTKYSGDSGSVVTTTTQTNNPTKAYTVETTVLDGMGFVHSVTDDLNTVRHSESHDIEGHLVASVDLAGAAQTQFGYDGFGRLRYEMRNFDGQFVPTASYVYDRNDRRLTVSDGKRNTTSFQYDAVDRTVVKTDAAGKHTLFQYYAGTHRIAIQTDPSGTIFARSYDAAGRAATERTAPGGGLDVGARQTAFFYDVAGRMNEVDYGGPGLQGWDNKVTMQFDSLGRKTREANSLFGFDVQHTYDLNGHWKTTSIAGATEQQSFDSLNRLAGVSLNGASLAIYHYGAAGLGGPLAIDYSTGARASFAYDQRNRQTDLVVQQGQTTLLSMHTGLGADGIPRERVQSMGGKRTITNAFQVDWFGRVTAESLGVPNGTPLIGDLTNDNVAGLMQSGTHWRSYGLDSVANWTSWTDSQAGQDQPALDSRNAYTTFAGKQPIYDTADNAVSIPDASGDEAYTFDAYKHPLSATKNGQSASFVYDGLGRRIVEQDASGTHYVLWDGSQLAARGTSRTDASQWTLEVGGSDIDDHIASVDNLGKGAPQLYHQSVDGSVLGITNANGFLEGYTYSAYGDLTAYDSDGVDHPDSRLNTRFLYHGQLFDPWTRTYSMRAREYRPTWGRFLSTDPIGLDGGLNLFGFVDGCPLHFRDPMGTHKSSRDSMSIDPNTLMSRDPSGDPDLNTQSSGSLLRDALAIEGTAKVFAGEAMAHIEVLGRPLLPFGLGGLSALLELETVESAGAEVLEAETAGSTAGTTFGEGTLGAAEGRIIQSGGRTLSKEAAETLNDVHEMNLKPREWGRALERLKSSEGLRNDFHGKLDVNGNYFDGDSGDLIGNVLDFLF